MKINHKTQELVDLVNDTCECNIMNKGRLRRDVDGRMIFSQILHQSGMSKSSIGRVLNKNHATIVYYTRKFDGYLKHDPLMRSRYGYISEIYSPNLNTPSHYNYGKVELLQEVDRLSKQIEQLQNERLDMRKELQEKHRKDIRLSSLYNLVKERTPVGREDELERKLTYVYNGVHK